VDGRTRGDDAGVGRIFDAVGRGCWIFVSAWFCLGANHTGFVLNLMGLKICPLASPDSFFDHSFLVEKIFRKNFGPYAFNIFRPLGGFIMFALSGKGAATKEKRKIRA
jgi:hypothetical protein